MMVRLMPFYRSRNIGRAWGRPMQANERNANLSAVTPNRITPRPKRVLLPCECLKLKLHPIKRIEFEAEGATFFEPTDNRDVLNLWMRVWGNPVTVWQQNPHREKPKGTAATGLSKYPDRREYGTHDPGLS
jgi:hypothetical protein